MPTVLSAEWPRTCATTSNFGARTNRNSLRAPPFRLVEVSLRSYEKPLVESFSRAVSASPPRMHEHNATPQAPQAYAQALSAARIPTSERHEQPATPNPIRTRLWLRIHRHSHTARSAKTPPATPSATHLHATDAPPKRRVAPADKHAPQPPRREPQRSKFQARRHCAGECENRRMEPLQARFSHFFSTNLQIFCENHKKVLLGFSQLRNNLYFCARIIWRSQHRSLKRKNSTNNNFSH